MSTLKNPIAFTANNLLDGEVVWLGRNGGWVKSIDEARVFGTEEERAIGAAEAARADADNLVVEPYEIDLNLDEGRIAPAKFRERIRAAGPTMRLDLGKQAELAQPEALVAA